MTIISLVVYKNYNYVFYFIIKIYTVKLYMKLYMFIQLTRSWIWKRDNNLLICKVYSIYSLINLPNFLYISIQWIVSWF